MDYTQKLIDSVEEIDGRIQKFVEKSQRTIDEIGTNQRELADRMLQIEQRGTLRMDYDGTQPAGGFGAAVAKAFEANADAFFKNRTLSLSVKAVTAAVVGAVASIGPGMKPDATGTSLLSAIPTQSAQGLASIIYSRMTDQGQAAGVQDGEGALKTEIAPVFTPITQNCITVAGFTVLSEQALKTSGELAKVIDGHLRQKVLLKADSVLLAGTAVTAWPFAGLVALATDYTSATYTSLHDAVVEAAAHMRWAGYEPDVVCLNPMSFLGIALAKATTGEYLAGSYMNELPAILHGMRVTFSANVALGKALVVDTRYTEARIGDELNVLFAYQNDDLIRNKITARAEMGIIPIARDTAAIRLVTPKP